MLHAGSARGDDGSTCGGCLDKSHTEVLEQSRGKEDVRGSKAVEIVPPLSCWSDFDTERNEALLCAGRTGGNHCRCEGMPVHGPQPLDDRECQKTTFVDEAAAHKKKRWAP